MLRTSWVYLPAGKNFLRTMLRLGAERSELRVVDDQVGAPDFGRCDRHRHGTIGGTICYARGEPSGGHLSHDGRRFDLLVWFCPRYFRAGVLSVPPRVQAIPSSAYPTPAKRPANSVLYNEKFAHTFGFRLPPWKQQLEEVLSGMQVPAKHSAPLDDRKLKLAVPIGVESMKALATEHFRCPDA